MFDNFDVNHNGKINSSELSQILKSLNLNLSEEATQEILREGDFDCNFIIISSIKLLS